MEQETAFEWNPVQNPNLPEKNATISKNVIKILIKHLIKVKF